MENHTPGGLSSTPTFIAGSAVQAVALGTAKVFYSATAFVNKDVTLAEPDPSNPIYKDARSPILILNDDGTFQVSGRAYATLTGAKMTLYYNLLTNTGKVVGRIPGVAAGNAYWEIAAGNNTWLPFVLSDGGYTYNNCIFNHIAAVQPYYSGI